MNNVRLDKTETSLVFQVPHLRIPPPAPPPFSWLTITILAAENDACVNIKQWKSSTWYAYKS